MNIKLTVDLYKFNDKRPSCMNLICNKNCWKSGAAGIHGDVKCEMGALKDNLCS